MATILSDVSRTFSEYLLIPRLTKKRQTAESVELSTPLSRRARGEDSRFSMNIPVVSACMQSVSGSDLSIALARQGGLSFIFCSQPIQSQVEMVHQVKSHKAGFVPSDSNVTPDTSLAAVMELMGRTGHSTIAVTKDGSATGKFLGLITDNDFWEFEDELSGSVGEYMTPLDQVIYGVEGLSLKSANQLLHKSKKECLPILDNEGRLNSLVFKKDYVDHRRHPMELLDDSKRLCVGAAINTHDYKERVPALVEAGADALCFDSSDGFTEYQKEGIDWIRENFGKNIVIGGGNVVSAEGFDYLTEDGKVDFIKVGMGGGSICITREQKGIGRGQASALLDVVARRDQYLEETGIYIPLCSDGGLANDTQIVVALSMGADFVMMGRYFAMTEESPTPRTSINGQIYKPYWGEGTIRAQNWQRYNDAMSSRVMMFEEGVDAYVPLVGSLADVMATTLYKLKSTMVNVGADSLADFKENAILTLVSEQSVVEAGTSTVFQFSSNRQLEGDNWGNH
jgi:IMP dehydrogenase